MHKNIPKIFIFLDQYNKKIFENNNINLGVIYRNYNNQKKRQELYKIANACKRKRFFLFVSNDIKLAIKVKADGIYIPSFNKGQNFLNQEKRNFKIIGSAHNQKEIYQKKLQKCEGIFLSPIFHVEKSKTFLNVSKFNYLTRNNKVNIFALGGINENNFRKLKLLNIKGIGGIKLFKKKTGLKKAGFYKE